MRAITGLLFATTVGFAIVLGISTSSAAHDVGGEAAIIVVAAGPPYGCGVGNGHGNGRPGNGNAGNPPGCRGVAAPPVSNPRQGIIERLQTEPSATIRLAIRRCINDMRGADWHDRYEACYYPSLTN